MDENTFLKAQAAAHNRRELTTQPARRRQSQCPAVPGLLRALRPDPAAQAQARCEEHPGDAQYIGSAKHCGEKPCPAVNARELELRLLPNLVRSTVSEAARTDRLDAKEAEHREAAKAAERLPTLLESQSSTLLARRFRELDGTGTTAGAEAAAIRTALYSSEGPLCDEDVEQSMDSAMTAMLDVTDGMATERAALRDRLARGYSAVWVCPMRSRLRPWLRCARRSCGCSWHPRRPSSRR